MKELKYPTDIKQCLKEWYGRPKMAHIDRLTKLLQQFRQNFGNISCYVCSASGRVELVGNHTDHNGGLVLGCTVDRDILAVFAPSDEHKIIMLSDRYRKIVLDTDNLDMRETNSRGMARGILKGLQNKGYKIGGAYIAMTSNVPVGAGMSSSAAYQLLLGQIQNHLYNQGTIDASELAQIGQFAENVYFNKPCGLLDQSVIAVGGTVRLDFSQNLTYSRITNNCNNINYVVIDTGGSHAALTDYYAAIPAEMKSVAQYFGKARLCEVDEQEVVRMRTQLVEATSVRAYDRAMHYYSENKRVQKACSALESGDSNEFLRIIQSSGDSSRYKLQNCSYDGDGGRLTSALDFCKGVLQDKGAVRVHGGGFAGTILCVVLSEYVTQFVATAKQHFGEDKVFCLNVRKCGATVM